MRPRRYSRDQSVRRQERFEQPQRRCDVDYHTPTIRDLRSAGIGEVRFKCANVDCGRVGEPFKLTRYWGGLAVRDLKKRQICGECWGRKMRPRILFQ
jgi:hypothetical protein